MRLVPALLAALAFTTGCVPMSAAALQEAPRSGLSVRATDEARVAGWRSDLAALPDHLAKHHPQPFAKRDRSAFEADLQALAASAPGLSDEAMTVRLAHLLATLGDSHTGLAFPPSFQPLPLRLMWFEDGLYAVAAAGRHRRALGCRLVRVEGVPVDDAIARVSGMVAAENEMMVRKTVPALLLFPPVLRGHGLLDRPEDACRFTFEGADGTAFTLDVSAGQGKLESVPTPGPTPEVGLAGDPYWLAMADAGTLYLNYRSCRENPAQPFARFARHALQLVEERGVRRVVIDLRENGGGDSSLITPLLDGLRGLEALKREGSVVVLIGRRTYSSGLLGALALKQDLGAVLLGEPTSGKPNHFGEVRLIEQPATRLRLGCSTKFFRRVPGDPASLEPDHALPLRAEAYLRGVDAALKAAIALP